MTVRQYVSHLREHPSDAFYYAQGVLRFWLYRKARWALRLHILQQFEYRKKAAQPCYYSGSCRCCGCRTPELFFADKGCSVGKKGMPRHCNSIKTPVGVGKPCYGPMLDADNWRWSKLMDDYLKG